MADDIVSKTQFAAIAGVGQARVSQWLKAAKISGDAMVGSGHRARIRVAVAMEQLRRNLDPVSHLGANGKARLAGWGAAMPSNGDSAITDTVEQEIKAARLEQLALSNAKASAEAALRSGRYVLADDARQEIGRSVSRILSVFESALGEFANAVMAEKPATRRDALRTLRTAWRTVRIKAAKQVGAKAAALPALNEDDGLLQ